MHQDQALPDSRSVTTGIDVEGFPKCSQSGAVLEFLCRCPEKPPARAISLCVVTIQRQRFTNGFAGASEPTRVRLLRGSDQDASFGKPGPGVRKAGIKLDSAFEHFDRRTRVPSVQPCQTVCRTKEQFVRMRIIRRWSRGTIFLVGLLQAERGRKFGGQLVLE